MQSGLRCGGNLGASSACTIHFKRVQDILICGSSSAVILYLGNTTLNRGGYVIRYVEFGGKLHNVR